MEITSRGLRRDKGHKRSRSKSEGWTRRYQKRAFRTRISNLFQSLIKAEESTVSSMLTANCAQLQMKCPSCGFELGDFPTLENASVECPQCEYCIVWDGACWDACVDKAYPRDFARQWVLWEAGKLGDPTLVYGNDPRNYFSAFLKHTSLTEEDLASKRILEIGFGHGRLL